MVAKKGIEMPDPKDLIDRIVEETVRVSKLTWDQRRAELPPTVILAAGHPGGTGQHTDQRRRYPSCISA